MAYDEDDKHAEAAKEIDRIIDATLKRSTELVQELEELLERARELVKKNTALVQKSREEKK